MKPLKIVILGLSITSSWGNGHATTYRALVKQLSARGHDVLFLERDVPWYSANRDMRTPPYGRTELYSSIEELKDGFSHNAKRHAEQDQKSGGQEGHPGSTLRFSEKPDEVIEHRVSVCASCQHDLREVEACVVRSFLV